jgi:hypothetical protein
MEARISSSVPASRPRIASPAMANRSALMSASRMVAYAAGVATPLGDWARSGDGVADQATHMDTAMSIETRRMDQSRVVMVA